MIRVIFIHVRVRMLNSLHFEVITIYLLIIMLQENVAKRSIFFSFNLFNITLLFVVVVVGGGRGGEGVTNQDIHRNLLQQ